MQNLHAKARALISIALTFILSVAGLTVGISPASAVYVNTLTSPNNIFTVGDSVNLNFSCEASAQGEAMGNSAIQGMFEAAPGTTIDQNLQLTGTLTTPGVFDLGVVRCYTNGSDSQVNWVNFGVGQLVVRALSTPTPFLEVHDLNTSLCEVLVTGLIPQTPESGSVKLVLNDVSTVTFASVNANELISLRLSLQNLSQSALVDPKVATFSGVGDLCATEVTYTLEYVYLGAPKGSTSKTLTVGSGPMPDMQVSVAEVLDEACTMRVKIRTNFLPEDEKLYLTFKEMNWATEEELASVTATVQLTQYEQESFYVDLLDFEGSLADAPVPTLQGDIGGIVKCQNVYVSAAAYLGVTNELNERVLSFVGIGSETNAWDQASPMCEAGTFGKIVQDEGKFTRNCLPAPVGHYVAEENVLGEPTPCRIGTFAGEIGLTDCTPAPAGSHVPHFGLSTFTPCPVGTFSPEEGAGECRPAAKGYYVDTVGATSAKKCAASKTTALDGARSANECYLQKAQTAKATKLPSVLKVGAKLDTPGTSDAGLAFKVYTTGPCTVKAGTKTVKIKGKSVKQPRWIITAGKTAGVCRVEYTNSGDYLYKPFSIIKSIKVTKTGK